MDLNDFTANANMVWQHQSVMAACRLGLFDLMLNPINLKTLARKLKIRNPRGLEFLLTALTAAGLVKTARGRCVCSPFSLTYLTSGSIRSLVPSIMHRADLIDAWAKLDQVVLTNRPVPRGKPSAQGIYNFMMSMNTISANPARIVAKGLMKTGMVRGTVIDIGGGPGAYIRALCQLNPAINPVLFDLPGTVAASRKLNKKYPEARKLRFISGDLFRGLPKERCDLALVSNIIHMMNDADTGRLFKNIYRILTPGGGIVIKDFYLNDRKTGPLFPALFALNMLVNTEAGKTYTIAETAGLLRQAGFIAIRKLKEKLPDSSTVLIARKPG